ncbi:MAG: hypothetical protein RL398_298 [Planctomycetota bacterium]
MLRRRRWFVLACCAALAACSAARDLPEAGALVEPTSLPPVVQAVRRLELAAPQVGGCERIASVSELRRARVAWGISEQVLEDGFVDFDHDALVFVDLGAAGGGVQLALSEEEGVDVVQVVRSAGEGRGRSPAVLALVVTRRPCQLAVVFRQAERDGPGVERTLAVFARD